MIEQDLLYLTKIWEEVHDSERSVIKAQYQAKDTTLLYDRSKGFSSGEKITSLFHDNSHIALSDKQIIISAERTSIDSVSVSLPEETYINGFLINPELLRGDVLTPSSGFESLKDQQMVFGSPVYEHGQFSVAVSDLLESKSVLTEAMEKLKSPILKKYLLEIINARD